jgi:hypothetical protein
VPSSLSRLFPIRLAVVVMAGLVAAGLLSSSATAATATGQLSGVVRDHLDETAISGASVLVRDPATGSVVAQTKTSPSGAYSAAVAPGTYDLEVAGGSSQRPYLATARGVDVGSTPDLDFSILRPATFKGTVRDGNGHPLSGIQLALSNVTNNYEPGGSAFSRPDGTFAIAVPAATYNLYISKSYGPSNTLFAAAASPDLSSDRTQDVTFPIGTVEADVHDQQGQPVAGAPVVLAIPNSCSQGCPADFSAFPGAHTTLALNMRGVTDINGRATLPVLPGHDLVLSASNPGTSDLGGPRRQSITVPSASPLDLVLPPTVNLTGTLADGDGTPLPGTITLENDEYQSAPAETGEDGAFTVAAPPGQYRLHVAADVGTESVQDGMANWDSVDGAFVTIADFVLPGDRTQDLRLPTAGFTATVIDAGGQPTWATTADVCSGGTATNCSADSLDTTGTAPVQLFPGGQGTGVLRNNSPAAFQNTLSYKIFPGAPPPTVTLQQNFVQQTVKVDPGVTSVTVQLPPTAQIVGTIGDARGPFLDSQGPSGDAYVAIDTISFDHGEAGLTNGHYTLQAPYGQHTINVADTDGYDENDQPTATLPAYWSITANYDVAGPATLNFVVPDTTAGDVMFVDTAGHPRLGDMAFSGTTVDANILLGSGLAGHGWIGTDVGSPGADGWLQIPLFGRSDLGGWLYDGDESHTHFRLSPGEHLIVATAERVPTANPGDPTGLGAAPPGPYSDASTISWNPPVDDGGGPIRSYTVSVSDSATAKSVTVDATQTTTSFEGLPGGATYTVTVTATNDHGTGPAATIALTIPPATPTTTPTSTPTTTTTTGPAAGPTNTPATGKPSGSGYWALGSDGHVYNFGDAPALGNAAADAVDLEPTPTGKGYWILNRDGTVQAFGDAIPLGNIDMSKLAKGEEPASLSATPAGQGYWVFTNRGRVLTFGDAAFLGDMSGTKLNGPVLGSVATPTGKGYYMVASDGGIFAFGDATFAGSMGGKKLNAPVQSLVPDGDGHGYWLVAADGGIFAFDASFRGSMGGTKLNKAVVGMVRYGDGYLMVGSDGGIFNFSSSPFAGSLGDKPPASPVVAVAALPL